MFAKPKNKMLQYGQQKEEGGVQRAADVTWPVCCKTMLQNRND